MHEIGLTGIKRSSAPRLTLCVQMFDGKELRKYFEPVKLLRCPLDLFFPIADNTGVVSFPPFVNAMSADNSLVANALFSG